MELFGKELPKIGEPGRWKFLSNEEFELYQAHPAYSKKIHGDLPF